MLLQIKILHRESLSLSVEPTDTVESLRQKIQSRTGIPGDQQRLIFGGKVLRDGKTLASYQLQDGDAVHLVARNERNERNEPEPARNAPDYPALHPQQPSHSDDESGGGEHLVLPVIDVYHVELDEFPHWWRSGGCPSVRQCGSLRGIPAFGAPRGLIDSWRPCSTGGTQAVPVSIPREGDPPHHRGVIHQHKHKPRSGHEQLDYHKHRHRHHNDIDNHESGAQSSPDPPLLHPLPRTHTLYPTSHTPPEFSLGLRPAPTSLPDPLQESMAQLADTLADVTRMLPRLGPLSEPLLPLLRSPLLLQRPEGRAECHRIIQRLHPVLSRFGMLLTSCASQMRTLDAHLPPLDGPAAAPAAVPMAVLQASRSPPPAVPSGPSPVMGAPSFAQVTFTFNPATGTFVPVASTSGGGVGGAPAQPMAMSFLAPGQAGQQAAGGPGGLWSGHG
ncbi:putative Ubiquitin family [Paratrimastix pyriformis]|uniref:Ubiquitin family n=1 Tax=Paratrimastix pyriformis TaxID=342808 RepID=A0ABQ8U838_9EUKA|nr:putative Ubiquitin family [Paratrimastix pyriformis]